MASKKYAESINQFSQTMKTLIFGENNTRLDYLIEQFYRLNHERRSFIIVSTLVVAIFFFIGLICLYFLGLYSLQSKLSSAYTNSNALREIKPAYISVQTKYEEITSGISSANANLNMISIVDQKAKDLGIQVSGFPSKPTITKFPNQNPLAENFQKESIDFKLSNISLKKMMEFINGLEQLPNKLKVTKYRLISITEAKLYFEVLLTVEAIIPNEKENK
ncbi:hypothetical protein ACWNT8_06510 [Pigmentibacter ruber]|nr:hypothetical protein GTC16762_27060 [Pigmentibacter ruber]